jgi:hypothetical protein
MPRNAPLRATLPRLPRPPGGSTLSRPGGYKGAVAIPRAKLTQESFRPYPPMPDSWTGPLSEWICWDYFVRVRKFRHLKDFFYQRRVPYLFNVTGRYRADFIFPQSPTSRVSIPGGYRALSIDPRNSFTHSVDKDRLLKAELGSIKILLIFVDTAQIESNPRYVLDLALRGVDVSAVSRS